MGCESPAITVGVFAGALCLSVKIGHWETEKA